MAVEALAKQLKGDPELPPLSADTKGLDPRDARLAVAIHRTALRHMLTADWLIRRSLERKSQKVHRALRAILVTAAVQLVFMDKQPAHAVVDDSVELAKRLGFGTAGMANAILRQIAEFVAERNEQGGWKASPSLLPWGDGCIRFKEPLLPPVKEFGNYYSVATSHPVELVLAWRKQFGDAETVRLLLHSQQEAPTIVRCGAGVTPEPELMEPHEEPGFFVATADHDAIARWLRGHPDCWVQDPASSRSLMATAELKPRVIVDYCAGMGTKTRQLAQLHPNAKIIATDPDAMRFAELQRVFAEHERVTVVPHDQMHQHKGKADLVVLDVPCSNSGVLARRLEARYRYSAESIASVAKLQREIITASAPLLRDGPGAAVLYATCSIEGSENEEQAAWAAERLVMTVTHQQSVLPGGTGRSYHDGSFHALLRR